MKLKNRINIVIGENNATIQINCNKVEFSKYKVLSCYDKNYYIGDIDLKYGKFIYTQTYKNVKIYKYVSRETFDIYKQIKKMERGVKNGI